MAYMCEDFGPPAGTILDAVPCNGDDVGELIQRYECELDFFYNTYAPSCAWVQFFKQVVLFGFPIALFVPLAGRLYCSIPEAFHNSDSQHLSVDLHDLTRAYWSSLGVTINERTVAV